MRFDQTFIAIRDRSILEILDLSLLVVTDHFKPLFWLLIIGATPWVLLDWWLVGWMADTDDFDALYYWIMLLLIVSQAQVGTSFMTHYLGQAMFVGRPGIWKTVQGVLKSTAYFWWSHGAIRMVVPVALCCLIFDRNSWDTSLMIGILLMPVLTAIGLGVRAFRPFVSEILLLERTPISKKDDTQVYFKRRSNSLHVAGSSDLFGRFAICAMIALPLGFACFALFVTIDSVLNIRSNSEISYSPFYWIAAQWMVAGFFCVARFLSYIDIRIRQEGWAVELRMRAEGQRLLDAIE